MASGFPSTSPDGLTRTYINIGAANKQRTAFGFPSTSADGLTDTWSNIGAAEKPDPISGTFASTLDGCTMDASGSVVVPPSSVAGGIGGGNGGGQGWLRKKKKKKKPTPVTGTIASTLSGVRLQVRGSVVPATPVTGTISMQLSGCSLQAVATCLDDPEIEHLSRMLTASRRRSLWKTTRARASYPLRKPHARNP